MAKALLELNHIFKHFGGVDALHDVHMSITKGSTHCLVGANGSGKSTLIKIISGEYIPDSGEICFQGSKFTKLSISESISLGIQVIYQDMSVFPNLTVAENIAMNYELYTHKKLVNWKQVTNIASTALQHIDIAIPLDKYVRDLTIAEKQLVAIARSVAFKSKLLIMDEPTTALTRNEINKLFTVIDKLKKEDVAILFVSHKLDEVFEIADKYTVLRDGRLIKTGDAVDIDSKQLIYYLTGRYFEEERYTPEDVDESVDLFKVEGLSLRNGFENISFSIHPKEIVGITGLLGSGRSELAKTLFGLYKSSSGNVYVGGNCISIHNPYQAVQNGIGYLPDDRLSEGVFLDKSIQENLITANIDKLSKMTINFEKAEKDSYYWVQKLGIKLNRITDIVKNLSGGNQQKVVLGKWLEMSPKILILNCPTVGVDIGAKVEIHKFLRNLVQTENIAVLLISDDIEEVLNNCNRIFIINQGRISNEYSNAHLTTKELQYLMMEDEV